MSTTYTLPIQGTAPNEVIGASQFESSLQSFLEAWETVFDDRASAIEAFFIQFTPWNFYETKAAGLADTSDGDFFGAPDDDGYPKLWYNDDGTAVLSGSASGIGDVRYQDLDEVAPVGLLQIEDDELSIEMPAPGLVGRGAAGVGPAVAVDVLAPLAIDETGLGLDIAALPAETDPDPADRLIIQSDSDDAFRKVALSDLVPEYPELIATVNANSGSTVVITDLPDARLRFQLVNVTCDTTSRLVTVALSNDNGSNYSSSIFVTDQGDFRDGVGGAIGFFEIWGQKRTTNDRVQNAAGNLTRQRMMLQSNAQVPSGHINAIRFSWSGGAANFASSTAGNDDSGSILVWRLS
jgi:hypothetical protein